MIGRLYIRLWTLAVMGCFVMARWLPDNPTAENCLSYATRLYIKHGGRLHLKASAFTPFPHVEYEDHGGVCSLYDSLEPKRRRRFPVLAFKGCRRVVSRRLARGSADHAT